MFHFLNVTNKLKACEIDIKKSFRRGDNHYPAHSPSLLGLKASSATLQHLRIFGFMDEQDNGVGAAIDFSILSDLKYLSVDAFSLWILARFTGQGQDVPLPLSLHTFRLGLYTCDSLRPEHCPIQDRMLGIVLAHMGSSQSGLANLTIVVPQDPIKEDHLSITNPEYLKQWNISRTNLKISPVFKEWKLILRLLKPGEIRE